MKVVLSGATGVVGMALLAEHVARGDDVLVLVNPDSARGFRRFARSGARVHAAGLNDYANLRLRESFDVFYHLAWSGGHCRDNWRINLGSTVASLDAVELADRLGCGVFVGAGSQAECGPQHGPISDTTECAPDTAFGAAKLMALQVTRQRARELGLRFAWARILSVYGPFDGEGTLVISTIRNILRNEPLAFTMGNQTWDFLYADDAARAIIEMSGPKATGGIYTIGSGEARPLREFIQMITGHFGFSADPFLGLRPSPPHGAPHLAADVSRLTREFDWSPRIGFLEGIDRTVRYCLETEAD